MNSGQHQTLSQSAGLYVIVIAENLNVRYLQVLWLANRFEGNL